METPVKVAWIGLLATTLAGVTSVLLHPDAFERYVAPTLYGQVTTLQRALDQAQRAQADAARKSADLAAQREVRDHDEYGRRIAALEHDVQARELALKQKEDERVALAITVEHLQAQLTSSGGAAAAARIQDLEKEVATAAELRLLSQQQLNSYRQRIEEFTTLPPVLWTYDTAFSGEEAGCAELGLHALQRVARESDIDRTAPLTPEAEVDGMRVAIDCIHNQLVIAIAGPTDEKIDGLMRRVRRELSL